MITVDYIGGAGLKKPQIWLRNTWTAPKQNDTSYQSSVYHWKYNSHSYYIFKPWLNVIIVSNGYPFFTFQILDQKRLEFCKLENDLKKG